MDFAAGERTRKGFPFFFGFFLLVFSRVYDPPSGDRVATPDFPRIFRPRLAEGSEERGGVSGKTSERFAFRCSFLRGLHAELVEIYKEAVELFE